MKKFVLTLAAGLLLALAAGAAPKSAHVVGDPAALYDLLDLERPGMEAVRKAVAKGDFKAADKELLKYFRNRRGIVQIDVDLDNVTIKKNEQRWADESLEHKFYAHKGYQPSYFYGDDIDWRYWPVKDNELRWQLHRHYWFIPLAKAYYLTRDARYIDAWIDQYTDWIRKNPLDGVERLQAAEAPAEEIAAEKENIRFAWRPMETGRRLQDQIAEFALTIQSPRFTPEFLNLYLRMFRQHADYVLHHFSKQGNHLLFEAQRMLYAGIYFPEFREAAEWRRSGVEILNREIGVQVYPDGMQFELDYGYHLASIDIFLKALNMARSNHMESEFPASYIEAVEKMTVVAFNLLFPDYTNPMFGDTKRHDKQSLTRQFRNWGKVFPENEQLPWFATSGKRGTMPPYTSQQFPASGFYVLRTGWDMASTVTVVKAGPPAFWHNQPDNGTFEYWHKGRNFFPDSGSYVYGGDKEVMALRNWFRQTRVHNTLTLDDRDLEKTDSKLLLWKTDGEMTVLVTENPSYEGLRHRRSMFFPGDGVLIIADQVSGPATGRVGVHFNLCPGKTALDKDGTLRTLFDDGNNIRVKTTCSRPAGIVMQEGWVSYAYREREERPAYAVEAAKNDGGDMLFITVIAPDDEAHRGSVAIVSKDATLGDSLSFAVRVGAKVYEPEYTLK
ncbi:heparinase II/III family protein [Alistipes sp.]|uniref:heparinase II/III family protein n=1 Tax=Alistipes sp. TaxID=1872444 RepID=UPI003AF06372